MKDTFIPLVSLFQFSSLEVLSVWLDSSEAGSLLPMQCILYATLTNDFHLKTHTLWKYFLQSPSSFEFFSIFNKMYLFDDIRFDEILITHSFTQP